MSYNPPLSAVSAAAFPALGIDYFPRPPHHLSLEVITVEDPASRDEKLSQAVNMLIPAALECRQGILVTEHDYGTYTVRIDQEVPCGMIQESRSNNLKMNS